MITSLLLLKGYRLKGSESGIRLTFGLGLLSKWVNRTAAFSGLPIVLFILSTSMGVSISRASLVACFISQISSRWDFPDWTTWSVPPCSSAQSVFFPCWCWVSVSDITVSSNPTRKPSGILPSDWWLVYACWGWSRWLFSLT